MAEGGIFAYDIKELPKFQRIIRDIEKRGAKVEKPLKRWGVYMLQETGTTFAKAGRGSVKWKPLAAVTKIMRKYRKRGSGRTGPSKPLQDTGHMKRSIKTTQFINKGTKAQIVYSRVPYAKTHQEGGTISIPARTIRPKKPGGVLAFEAGGKTVFARQVKQPAKTKKVPQRKVLFIETKDKNRALKLLKVHAQEVAKGTGKK